MGFLWACSGNHANEEQQLTQTVSEMASVPQTEEDKTEERDTEEVKDWSAYFKDLELTKRYKGMNDNNPIMTQSYGADPYAMVYGDRVYFYMTGDAYEYDAQGNIIDNSYGKIQTIRVVSTEDMVNFTDHGAVHAASGPDSAKWARNSWAPAAAWKEIDGKVQFFLYFADAGGGIGVLQSDSPTGPFTDPLGTALITRNTPNCQDIVWLFDPAVLVDDDGRAYLYFGGGVPKDQAANPQTARVVELGADMVSIKGEPQMIDAPYLFEDSGIHKAGGKYYYTYCSNWQVDEAGTEKYGFANAEIISMESGNPMGPFVFKEKILENPGKAFGLYGNNHHCVFSFKNQWYITYHTRLLEQQMGVEKGYRCTHVNAFEMEENGTIGIIKQTREGCAQIRQVNPYEENMAVNMAVAGGVEAVASEEASSRYGCGDMALGGIDPGDFIQIKGVDFAQKKPSEWKVSVRQSADVDESCVIQLRIDSLKGDVIGYLPAGQLLAHPENAIEDPAAAKFVWLSAELSKEVKGVHDLYLVFSGSGYEIKSWYFDGTDEWYSEMLPDSLISKGTNGRLEKVFGKLADGEKVSVACIGGSVTEGAGASKVSESYTDRMVQYLRDTFTESEISYVNAGLGGTPSPLGAMRYQRDVVDALGGNPDLVILEFAVNDHEEVTGGRAYESLVRTILGRDEDTAVILVFAVFKSKWNMQDVYIPVGEHYGLPMVSVKNFTDSAYEAGKLTDKEYFSDEFHPTSYGHGIMADCIQYLFEQVDWREASGQTVSEPASDCVYGLDFQNMTLLTAKDTANVKLNTGDFSAKDEQVHIYTRTGNSAFPDNWMYAGEGGNKELKLELECKNILVDFKLSSSEEFGTAELYVDGAFVTDMEGYSEGGWNNSNVVLALDEKECARHELVIKMKEGSEKKKFTVLAIGYSQ